MKDENLAVGVIIVICAVVLLGLLGTSGMMGYGGGYGMMSGYGFGGFGILSWLLTILIAVTLVLFCIWLVKQIFGGKQ